MVRRLEQEMGWHRWRNHANELSETGMITFILEVALFKCEDEQVRNICNH